MKYVMSLVLLVVMSGSALAAPMHYTGDISGSGNYSGNLDINFGWIDPPGGLNSWGDHIDLWQIDGNAGDTLSLALSSDELALGFSLYFGEITSVDLLMGLFDNDGDIGSANYLTGASLWNSVQTLQDFVLDQSGLYTLVIGGRDFAGYTSYSYDMSVVKTSVSEPSAFLLLSAGLLGLAGLRRRRLAR
jgi:hypothetical protein